MQNTDPAVRKAAFALGIVSAHSRLEILMLITESPASALRAANATGTTMYVAGSALIALANAKLARCDEDDRWHATEAGRLVVAAAREMMPKDDTRPLEVGIANTPEIMP